VTLILAGFYARQSLVTPLKRAGGYRSRHLPRGRLHESYPESEHNACSEHMQKLSSMLRPCVTGYFQQWREYYSEAKPMPIPDSQTLLLPVLRVVADGHEHSSEEIRERVRVQFDTPPHEVLQKFKNGTAIFTTSLKRLRAVMRRLPSNACWQNIRNTT